MRLSTLTRGVVGLCCALFTALPAAAQTSAPFFTHGVACGEPPSTDAVLRTRTASAPGAALLWARTASAAAVTPELLDDGGAVQRALPAVRTSAETDFTVKTIAP